MSRLRVVAWLVLTTVLLGAWVGWLLVARGLSPSDDARLSGALYPTSEWSRGVVLHTVLDPRGGGLRKGDRVFAVDGEPLVQWLRTARGRDFEAGDRLTYSVTRSAETSEVAVTLRRYDWEAAARLAAPILALEAVLFLTASFVLVRRPRDPAARVLFAVAAVLPFGFPAWPLRGHVVDLALFPWPLWPQIASAAVWAVVWGAMLPHFALVFPTRPRVLDRARWAVPAMYATPFLLHAAYLAVTLPQAADRLESLERVSTVSVLPERFGPAVVVGLLVWAYLRTSDPVDRRRVAFVVTALGGVFGLNFVWAQLPELVLGDSLVPYPANAWVFVLCPLAIALAVLRSQLFDITVVLRRSLIAGGLAVALSTAYVLSLWMLGPVPARHLPVFLLGMLVTLVLLGSHRWLRRRVDRRMYGARGDPLEVVELIDRVESGSDPEHVLRQLVDALADALRLPYVAITVTYDAEIFQAVHGTPRAEPIRLPLARGGSAVGHIDIEVGPTREPFGPADRRLLAAIAAHTTSAVQTARTNAELHRSQVRLLSSREEERRRIRRDLHDGVGSTLALLAMDLEVAREMLGEDPPGARAVLDHATSRAQDAISDVRRTVNDLRPPVLDELGLGGAATLLADRVSYAHQQRGEALMVTVELAGDLLHVEAAVEVAAYRILTEALTNVSRHSGARRCLLSIERADTLRLQVEDDGRGLPSPVPAGQGLDSIRARATELGGSAIVGPRDRSGGCVVSVSLPLDTFGAVDVV